MWRLVADSAAPVPPYDWLPRRRACRYRLLHAMIKFISSRSGPAGAGGEFLPLPPTGVDSVAYASLNARATTRRQVDMLLRSSPLQLDAGSGGAEVDTTAASFAVPMLVTYQRRLVRLAYDCYSDSWGPCVALADYSHAYVARWCGAV